MQMVFATLKSKCIIGTHVVVFAQLGLQFKGDAHLCNQSCQKLRAFLSVQLPSSEEVWYGETSLILTPPGHKSLIYLK